MGTIVNHRITRVECKREKEEIKNYALSYNIDIQKKKIENKVLKMDYAFTILYREGMGGITVEGSLSYKDTLKALKEADKKWSENTELQRRVYNVIFRNSIIMVMDMARHVGLPSPIPLPDLQPADFSQEK
jgi:hypothetical protein